ncbi:hypothetical protein TL16_g11942 [Triparma laevis f. inornata]|uniref:UBP-type domain-containing protein n=1 Tax=Triparma laevis f. inornata TaxID=1714386 RepID=A0A9W7BN97_9STRA|nr:hypothetical protein TL16_g11942 [Triparma laevis f. inornata]
MEANNNNGGNGGQDNDASELMAAIIAAQMGDSGSGPFSVYPETFSPNISCVDNSTPWTTSEAASALSSSCSNCGSASGENWVCLKTRKILCSRYVNGCAVAHFQQNPDSPIHLSVSDLSIWDHNMDAYLDVFAIEELKPAFEAFHMAKHGIEAVFHDRVGGEMGGLVEGMVIDMKGQDDDDDKKPAAK